MATGDFVQELEQQIASVRFTSVRKNVGRITEVSDGIAWVEGLSEVGYGETIKLPHGLLGMALNLQEAVVGIIVFGDWTKLKEHDQAETTGQTLSIAVGETLLGRVITSLGEPLDGKGVIKTKSTYPIERIAPGVISRQPVETPLETGIKAIDAMIPIGRGQRELIIGDRGLGKTALALDSIINQKGKNVVCIYVAIGQKASKIAQLVATLEKHKALAHTVVVTASASDSAALQFIAPYVGCAIGEYFMDKGQDALVVYDDLTKHAWAYRELSLLLRRPSGREAYPGDIFYLHSRLLERAARLNDKLGGGSLTALPIIETQAGDVSAYIPTNVISITDGQIYLEADLFFAGTRPAIDVGLSVSRVGGKAQTRAIKQAAATLRLDLAQYRELAAFAQFGSDLDETTRTRLERGKRLVELLKQPNLAPLSQPEQVALLWSGTAGYVDDIPQEAVREFEEQFLEHLQTKEKKLLETIAREKTLSEKLEKELKRSVEEFKKRFKHGNK